MDPDQTEVYAGLCSGWMGGHAGLHRMVAREEASTHGRCRVVSEYSASTRASKLTLDCLACFPFEGGMGGVHSKQLEDVVMVLVQAGRREVVGI